MGMCKPVFFITVIAGGLALAAFGQPNTNAISESGPKAIPVPTNNEFTNNNNGAASSQRVLVAGGGKSTEIGTLVYTNQAVWFEATGSTNLVKVGNTGTNCTPCVGTTAQTSPNTGQSYSIIVADSGHDNAASESKQNLWYQPPPQGLLDMNKQILKSLETQ